MNFENNNFLFKELVETYSYTTATKNREGYKNVNIKGRRYVKCGTFQSVTFVGNLYNIGKRRVLVVGMSRQHPYDTKLKKDVGYEIAYNNALDDPCMMIDIHGKFTKYRFKEIVLHYLSTIKLHFIKTREEIEAEGKDPNAYDR